MKTYNTLLREKTFSLSLALLLFSVVVSAATGYPGLSLVLNWPHVITLSLLLLLFRHSKTESSGKMAVYALWIFFSINVIYVFSAGLVFHFFRTALSASLVFYYLTNLSILFNDTVVLLKTVPPFQYLLLLLVSGAGYFIISAKSKYIPWGALARPEILFSYLSLLSALALINTAASSLSGCNDETGSFHGVNFREHARGLQHPAPGFSARYGYNITGRPDIVIILLESVSAELFEGSGPGLFRGSGAVTAERFFVPVPHTSVSIYSLLTGNYGDYRSRQSVKSSEAENSLPALFRREGYATYFLYSGPTYFEGLHDMLKCFGMTIINKEDLEQRREPGTGANYRSFDWGVDDLSLCDAAADLKSRNRGPGLYIIGLSATHSPYFNPRPDAFNRFDNNTLLGRYRNCIDYEIFIIERLMSIFSSADSNTLFIVAGDHGESFGQEGFTRHSFSLYNTELRVPFIMCHKSFSGRIGPFSGTMLDVYPTIADVTGLHIPAAVEGRSMFALDYSLKLFLSSWKEGKNKGLILGERKWIYAGDTDSLYEMDLDDNNRRDITHESGSGSFVRFLRREY